jgi:hypothetical protein
MDYKVNGGFSCDRQSKYDFTASTVTFLNKWVGDNKKASVIFKEYDKNGNEIPFDDINSNDKSRTDLIMYINGYRYVIELKERWGKYTSNFYGKDDDKEGWMLNIEKVTELNKIDAIPLYVNLYPDGYVRIWNLNKISDFKTITKNIHKTTVMDSEIKKQDRYEVWNKDSLLIPRTIGEKSNGVWVS